MLNLSAQNIGAGGAEALGRALRDNLSITSVDCSRNAELGNEGVEFLVPALRTDGTGISTIRVLSLMRCGIGEVGKRKHLACQNNGATAVFVVSKASRHAHVIHVLLLRYLQYVISISMFCLVDVRLLHIGDRQILALVGVHDARISSHIGVSSILHHATVL